MTWHLGDTVHVDVLKVCYVISTVTVCTESKLPRGKLSSQTQAMQIKCN